MPIKPENRTRYPADWPAIRFRILQRARYRCEHDGCNAVHREEGYWDGARWVRMPTALRDAGYRAGHLVACDDGRTLKLIRIILTIAHLDHTPENCADDNLRAWCQKHHLGYAAAHHAETARATRRAALRTPDMFELTNDQVRDQDSLFGVLAPRTTP